MGVPRATTREGKSSDSVGLASGTLGASRDGMIAALLPALVSLLLFVGTLQLRTGHPGGSARGSAPRILPRLLRGKMLNARGLNAISGR